MAELRNQILSHYLRRWEGTFAGGQKANNKLELEEIERSIGIRAKVIVGVTGLIRKYHPDLVVGTPNGANWLALESAWMLGRGAILLNKEPLTKEFSYRNDDERKVRAVDRVVVVDDVLNELTNTGKVYRLPHMADHTQAIVGIWDRNPNRQAPLPVPVEALITEEIPPMLPDDSPLWRGGQ